MKTFTCVSLVAVLLLILGCGGGSPPDSLKPGERFRRLPVRKVITKLFDDGSLVYDVADCSGSTRSVLASRAIWQVDASLKVVSRTPPLNKNVPMDESLAVTPGCSGWVLRRSWFEEENSFHLHDLLGKEVRVFRLTKPGRATLVARKDNPPLVAVAQEGMPTQLQRIDGGTSGSLPTDCSGGIRSGDLLGDSDEEILCESEHGLVVHDQSGRIAASLPVVASWTLVNTSAGKREVMVLGVREIRVYDGGFTTARSLALPAFDHYVALASAAKIVQPTSSMTLTLLGGRGGWHRTTVLIHNAAGELVFHEVLDGDYEVARAHGTSFRVFGRGDVITYTP